MGQIKDFIGITIGASLLSPVLGAIGSGFTGATAGIGRATQVLVAGGFAGSVAGKVGNWFK